MSARNSRLTVVLAATFIGVGLAIPSSTDAQETFSDDEFVVVGEILKPEITVVISRENLNKSYELRLEESFLDRIIESVRHEPF